MDKLFFDSEALKRQCGPGGRVIVFGFMRGSGIFLSRLMEVLCMCICVIVCVSVRLGVGGCA